MPWGGTHLRSQHQSASSTSPTTSIRTWRTRTSNMGWRIWSLSVAGSKRAILWVRINDVLIADMTCLAAGFVEAAARAAQADGAHVRGSPSICLVPQHNVCQSPGCSGPLTQVRVLIPSRYLVLTLALPGNEFTSCTQCSARATIHGCLHH